MRTFSEVNRDIQQCKEMMELAVDRKTYLYWNALLCGYKEERELIWDTLYKGHRNRVIL